MRDRGTVLCQAQCRSVNYITLKAHCDGDFAVYWSKVLKYLTKNLFSNMKSLLQHRERRYETIFPSKNKL